MNASKNFFVILEVVICFALVGCQTTDTYSSSQQSGDAPALIAASQTTNTYSGSKQTDVYTAKDQAVEEQNTSEIAPQQSEPKKLQKKLFEKYIFGQLPANSLNIYNTYWDNFSGEIYPKIKYRYSNKLFASVLHFQILQVLDEKNGWGRYLVWRGSKDHYETELDLSERYIKICTAEVFYVESKHMYADGAKLRSGYYTCLGTYTYETKDEVSKTVYAFREIEPSQVPVCYK